jgi:type I restriction enzyme S subunit
MSKFAVPAGWNLTNIGSVLKKTRTAVNVEPERLYRQIGIRSHGKGIFYKDECSGKVLGEKSVFWIEPDCFIVNIVFAWEQAVAKTTANEKGMIASHRFPMYKPVDRKLDLDYIVYFFKTPFGKHLLGLASPGGAGRNKTLGQEEFQKLTIALPPYSEQCKIAEILSTWDEAIAKTEGLIITLRGRKMGLMQRLLTGRVRFPGFDSKWKDCRLGEVGTFSKGSGIAKSDLVEKGIPCIRYGEIYTTHNFVIKEFHSFITPEMATTSKQIYAGDILFSGSGETAEEIGKCVAFVGKEVAYAGGDVIILRLTKGDPIFMGYLLNHETVKKQKYRLAQGHSVVHIYERYLKDIKIPFPPIEEQQIIAQALQTCDEEIDLHERKLSRLKQQKKGLMQRLLTGQVRVKVN